MTPADRDLLTRLPFAWRAFALAHRDVFAEARRAHLTRRRDALGLAVVRGEGAPARAPSPFQAPAVAPLRAVEPPDEAAQFVAEKAARDARDAAARNQRTPYIATVMREADVPNDDVIAGRALRKLFRHLGVPLTTSVRRYSMASGMNLAWTGPKLHGDLSAIRAAVQQINDVLPGQASIGGEHTDAPWLNLRESIYLYEREDASDWQTDYYSPGGTRIRREHVPALYAFLVQVRDDERAKRERKQADAEGHRPEPVTVREGDFYVKFASGHAWVYRVQSMTGIPVIGTTGSGKWRSAYAYRKAARGYTPDPDKPSAPAPWFTPARVTGKFDNTVRAYIGGNAAPVKALLERFGFWTPGARIFHGSVVVGRDDVPLPIKD